MSRIYLPICRRFPRSISSSLFPSPVLMRVARVTMVTRRWRLFIFVLLCQYRGGWIFIFLSLISVLLLSHMWCFSVTALPCSCVCYHVSVYSNSQLINCVHYILPIPKKDCRIFSILRRFRYNIWHLLEETVYQVKLYPTFILDDEWDRKLFSCLASHNRLSQAGAGDRRR